MFIFSILIYIFNCMVLGTLIAIFVAFLIYYFDGHDSKKLIPCTIATLIISIGIFAITIQPDQDVSSYVSLTSPNKSNGPVPDGSTPNNVMSIDLEDTDYDKFLMILNEATGKEVLKCKQLTGKIQKYRSVDRSYQAILMEVATNEGWTVENTKNRIKVCKR